jgi:hypothetical protein
MTDDPVATLTALAAKLRAEAIVYIRGEQRVLRETLAEHIDGVIERWTYWHDGGFHQSQVIVLAEADVRELLAIAEALKAAPDRPENDARIINEMDADHV